MNQWIATWLRWLDHDRRLAPTTCKLYERTVLGLERDLAQVSAVEQLSAGDLRAWLHAKGGSTASYGNRVAALKSFYGYLAQRNAIKEDPTASLDVPKREPPARTPVRELNEKLRLLNELDAKTDRRVGESADMATFLAQSGMRVADACQLSLKPPVPAQIRVARPRRPDKVIQLNVDARAALDRLGGGFGIGPRALQRRFEKVGFHPDQLRHWHRINVADRDLRDTEMGESSGRGSEPALEAVGRRDAALSSSLPAVLVGDPLTAVGRFLRLAEDVTAVLVREARRQGRSWEEIAEALSIPEATARQRFAAA